MNNSYQLGFEIGYLSLLESTEKLNPKDLESEDSYDFLLNVLGTKRGIQSNNWKTKRISKGIGIVTKDKKIVLIIQNSSKKWLYNIKIKEQNGNIKEFQGVTPDKIVSAIHSLLGDERK